MGISVNLSDLLETGIAKGYFTSLPIKDIDKSCCSTATTEVIDFDTTKNIISKGGRTPKSCDGLKIMPHLERVDFIEMKGFKDLVNWSGNKRNAINLDKEAQKKIASFNLLGKIADSLTLFQSLIISLGIDFNVTPKKFYVLLTDVEPSKNEIGSLALNLAYLAAFSTSFEKQMLAYLQIELDKIPIGMFEALKVLPPIPCGEIDQYYASL